MFNVKYKLVKLNLFNYLEKYNQMEVHADKCNLKRNQSYLVWSYRGCIEFVYVNMDRIYRSHELLFLYGFSKYSITR